MYIFIQHMVRSITKWQFNNDKYAVGLNEHTERLNKSVALTTALDNTIIKSVHLHLKCYNTRKLKEKNKIKVTHDFKKTRKINVLHILATIKILIWFHLINKRQFIH